MTRPDFGPRYLTRAEKRRYGSMSSVELKRALNELFSNGTALTIVNQVRSILMQRVQYERAVPGNNGKALSDR